MQLDVTVSDAHMDAFRQQLQSEQKQAIMKQSKDCIHTQISPCELFILTQSFASSIIVLLLLSGPKF